MSLPLDIPLEKLLSSGGDTRLEIDRKTGRNRYACLARPGEAVPFGSCTSSTVSPRGFKAAGETQQMFCQAHDPVAAANEYAGNVRKRLREFITLPADVEIALGPSGTDIELLALALAAGAQGRRVMNIVVGPVEIGSGSPLAAACCHYDCLTPGGRQVVTGLPIDTELAARVSVRTVDLRALSGEMLSESEIDTAVIELVIEATEQDAIVLLHVVAHSKTGMHAPSLPCVERLRQISDDIVVVVDAAQGRFSRRGLRDALQKDYLVMFTGSKFYGGPPFSGALLVPPSHCPAARALGSLPARFGDYFTAVEIPESWTEIRSHLPAEPNYGALLRWSAALAEIEAYYRVPNDARLKVLRYFEAEVPGIFGGSEAIRMLPVFSPIYDDTTERLLESKTTVFSFWVKTPGARQPLGKDDLKKMHVDLTTDASASCEGSELDIAARKFHIGQPVDLGDAGCVLRIALGGELIVRVATDSSLGETLDDRLEWLERQIVGLRQKIECLAKRHAPSRATTVSSRDRETVVFDYGQAPNEPFATTELPQVSRRDQEMDVYNSRVTVDEAAAMLRAAQERKLLDSANAAIFHDLGRMRARIAALQATFPAQTLHAVAIKANPVVEILREVVRAGAGLEAASFEEVELALAAGCPAERIVFDSPAKSRDDIEQALRRGTYLNADNFDELGRIAAVRTKCDSTSVVGLRVNPGVGGGTIAHTSVAESESKFGVPLATDGYKILAAFAAHPWLAGLHVHVGSQGCGLELLVEAATRMAALRRAIVSETGRNIPHVDLGGGLPTVYRAGQTAPTPAEYRALLEKRAPELFAPDLRLVTEFGRSIQANCGVAASRVEYVKPERRLAVIHLGADFLLRPVYRPEDWQHEFFVLDRRGKQKLGPAYPTTIAGPLCFAGDVVAREVPLPPIDEGDWIVIRDVGAYTLSMWSRHCSRGIPAVIGYEPPPTESVRVLRAAETPADMVRFWS